MPMELKLDEAGHVVVQDGKPVYVMEDGKEVPHDAAFTVATITRLNGEAKVFRERAEAAEGGLKKFEAIEDLDKAIEAMETVKNLDSGALVTANKVKEIKDAAQKAAEEQVTAQVKAADVRYRELETDRDSIRHAYHSEKIGGAFKGSEWIDKNCIVPPAMMYDTFGKNIKVEDNKLVGYGPDGQKIYSRQRPGELADFDEILPTLVEAYPYKDHILKGSNSSGAGTEHSKGGGVNPPKGNIVGTQTERVDAVSSMFPDLPRTSKG